MDPSFCFKESRLKRQDIAKEVVKKDGAVRAYRMLLAESGKADASGWIYSVHLLDERGRSEMGGTNQFPKTALRADHLLHISLIAVAPCSSALTSSSGYWFLRLLLSL